MTPYFIADLHMGHKNIHRFRKVFVNALHNDLYFMEILQLFNKRVIMNIVGDAIFDKKYLPFFHELPYDTRLILGNHDQERGMTARDLLTGFDDLAGIIKYKEYWITHAPMHVDELRGKKNIHGHVHDMSIQDARYLNVSADSSLVSFMPISLDILRKKANENVIFDGIPFDECEHEITNTRTKKEIYERTKKKALQTTVILTENN